MREPAVPGSLGPSGVVTIHPSIPQGSLRAPPSKSYTHRALVLGVLSEQRLRIRNPLSSEDTLASLEATEAFGRTVHREPSGSAWTIETGSVGARGEDRRIDCRESGTTLRLFTTVAARDDVETRFAGRPSLARRPMNGLWNALEDLGAVVRRPPSGDGLPFSVRGPIHPGEIDIETSTTSQYLSSLLMVLPTLPGPSRIRVIGSRVSHPYVEATLAILERFGGTWRVETWGYGTPGAQRYKGEEFEVPGDASSAAYFWAWATLTGGEVRVEGSLQEWPQADLALLEVLPHLGARVVRTTEAITVKGGSPSERSPFEFDLSQSPDLAPILGVLAAFVPGESHLKGMDRLIHKESDRREQTARLVRALDARAEREASTMKVWGPPGKDHLNLWDLEDHRVLLSAVVAATALSRPSRLGPAHACQKSYPGFFADAEGVGLVWTEGERDP